MYTCQISCLLMFQLLSFGSSTGKEDEEHDFHATVKLKLQVLYTSILQDKFDLFLDIISH